MKKPFYQRFLQVTTWIGGGILLLGALLDSLSNTITLVTIPSAFLISLSLIGLYILTTILLHQKKIVWITSSGEAFRITSLGKQINYSLIGIIILLWIGAIVNYPESIKNNKEKKPIFSINTQGCKVLILPFQKECEFENKKYDIGQVIQKRLQDINRKDSLNLQVHYLTDSIDFNNFTVVKADSIRKYHAASLIVYGSYSYRQCEDNTTDKICFNYIADDSSENLEDMQTRTGYKMQTFTGLDDIRRGTGQENIDYVIYYIAGVSLSIKKEFSEALKKFQRIPFNRQDERILHKIATCYYEMKNYDKANEYLQALLNIKPNDYAYLNNKGVLYLVTNKIKNAKKCFEKILTQNPTEITALEHITLIYAALRDTIKENEYLDKIIKQLPLNKYSTYMRLGRIYFELGKVGKAKEYYVKLFAMIDSCDYDAEVATELGEISLRIGDTLRAFAYLRKAVEKDSTFSYALFKLGEYYSFIRQDPRQSLACFDKVVKLRPYDPIAWANLGMDYFQIKESDKAIECIERSLALSNQSTYTQYLAAQIYAENNQYIKAIDCMKRSIQISPYNYKYWFLLGNLYSCIKDYQKAFDCLKTCCDLSKKCEYSYTLAELSAKLRQKENALFYLAKACKEVSDIKMFAKSNYAFDWLWNNPDFKAIVQ